MNLADRVRTIPKKLDTFDRSIVREWYVVKMANGVEREVFFCPPQTQAEVMTVWYPGCGVTPR